MNNKKFNIVLENNLRVLLPGAYSTELRITLDIASTDYTSFLKFLTVFNKDFPVEYTSDRTSTTFYIRLYRTIQSSAEYQSKLLEVFEFLRQNTTPESYYKFIGQLMRNDKGTLIYTSFLRNNLTEEEKLYLEMESL